MKNKMNILCDLDTKEVNKWIKKNSRKKKFKQNIKCIFLIYLSFLHFPEMFITCKRN